MVYMFFVKPEGMLDRDRRFNAQVASLHASMATPLAGGEFKTELSST
jgi:hypothetical protein